MAEIPTKDELLDKPYYFWFSRKQLQGRGRFDSSPKFDSFVVIGGVKRQFTERTLSDKPSGRWDDYELLGVATERDVTHRPAAAL